MSMIKKLAQLASVLVFVLLVGSSVVFAQKTPVMPPGSKVPVMPAASTSQSSTTGPANFTLGIKLSNPLSINTIQDAIKYAVNAVVKIAIPIIVFFFIWSGLRFIWARGNPEELAAARRMFFYTIIGTLLILGAWTITNALVGTVNSVIAN